MASLFEVAVLLLCVAFSGLHTIQQVLDYLRAISPRNPIASATAGAAALVALCVAYFTGVILVHLRIAPALPSPVVLVRRFAATACALLLLLLLAVM